MAIYNIFDYCDKQNTKRAAGYTEDLFDEVHIEQAKVSLDDDLLLSKKDRFFSSLAARLFFLLLLIADIFWGIYHVCLLLCISGLCLLTAGKIHILRKALNHSFLSMKRSLVCGLALLVAIPSPALGIMFACTYFLMYDKEGIEEVVPTSLQHQFKAFFHPESH